ncbi:uncharacterized protein LOC114519057 [Dendronephthya gigantea]|uniref:uncharacterized protein LOC114519057 n=1 Tax=Dendronephthya gigantea TaxID=151771 RepID=UPI00106A5FB9|nr:uncharacterized protein LOC114519057 [Dendronephthya gigantea]
MSTPAEAGMKRESVASSGGYIDVAKLVLLRLSNEWQTNINYRNSMKAHVVIPCPQNRTADWQSSMDRLGWSLCGNDWYMTGMWRHDFRSEDERIGRIEYAECHNAPRNLYPVKGEQDCYEHDWSRSFDHQGWSTCKNGYYMTGLYKSNGQQLRNIETAKCCRPRTQVEQWGQCYNLNVAFNHRGWSKCPHGYYMAGLYRNACESLSCIERFKCCKMGPLDGNSWIESPNLRIVVKDAFGQFKQCSINATDNSGSTYQCKSVSSSANLLELSALKFIILNQTSIYDANPETIDYSHTVTCSAYLCTPYQCNKTLITKGSTFSTLKPDTWFSVKVKIEATVDIDAELFDAETRANFTEIINSSSLNQQQFIKKTYTKTYKTDLRVLLPENTKLTVNFKRKQFQYLEYKWKGLLELSGKYSIKWQHGRESILDVKNALSGPKREINVFGKWIYPGNDDEQF